MQLMQRKHVFSSRGIDLPSLFDGLQLVCRELHLHLQCGLLGARRRQLHSVRCRKVQDVERNRPVHGLSIKLQLVVSGELNFVELHLRRRIHALWRGVHTVHGRNIQGVAGSRPMQRLQPKHIFNSWGIGMPRLSVTLQLVLAEDNLHLQFGLLWA
jgi:hypothetical protein